MDAGADLLAHLGVSGGDGDGGNQQFGDVIGGFHGSGGLTTDLNLKLDGPPLSYGRGPFRGLKTPFGGRRGPFNILNGDNINAGYGQGLGRKDFQSNIGESLLGSSLGMGGVGGHIGDGGLANDLGLKLYRAQQSLGNLGQAAQSSLGETKNLLNTLEVANDYVKSALSSGVGHYQEGMDTSGHEFQNQEGTGGMGNLVGADGLSDALKLKLYRADQSLGDLSRAAQTTFAYTEDLLKTVATDIDYSKHLKNVWDTIVEIERLKIETGLDLLNHKLQGIDDLVGFVSTGGLADGLKQKLYRVEQSLGYLSRAAQASVGYTEGLLQVLGTDESYAQPALGLDIDNMQEGIGKPALGLDIDNMQEGIGKVRTDESYAQPALDLGIDNMQRIVQMLGTDESYAQPALGLGIDNMQEGIGKIVQMLGTDESYAQPTLGLGIDNMQEGIGKVRTDESYAQPAVGLDIDNMQEGIGKIAQMLGTDEIYAKPTLSLDIETMQEGIGKIVQMLGTDESYAQLALGLGIDNMQEGIGKPALGLGIENMQEGIGKSDGSLAGVGFQNYKGFDGLVDLQGGDGLSTGLDLNLEGPQQSYIDLAKGVQTSGGIEDPLGIYVIIATLAREQLAVSKDLATPPQVASEYFRAGYNIIPYHLLIRKDRRSGL
ncbi:hypothetical protein J6590_052810 [Homalodisca vitripennis]|nr:hypothetical protein J6590_052810 [Homalodisca vitripennis]